MSYDPIDSSEAYDRRMFSDEARAWRKADCARQADQEQARHAAEVAADAATASPNGPWINDGDRWCCDYCNATPRMGVKLPKACHACGSVALGGIMAKECAA